MKAILIVLAIIIIIAILLIGAYLWFYYCVLATEDLDRPFMDDSQDKNFNLVKGSGIHCGDCDRYDECNPDTFIDCAKPENVGMIYKEVK